ncbi:MAG: thioredoxin domain-containing protein [Flavobacteriales bacterium]|nr:thioredoxin domain-containing protein [Flavobacteriales bacterium]
MKESDHTEQDDRPKNGLAGQTSPYLLQHQYNPVDWQPWSQEIFQQAEQENKLILVSIGYSSCHWCHVMEHESFEDDSVAAVMNRHFISVKVDREERPDVDQIYMNAVQLMTGRGGWPLNCFTLPDGRPVYGGTYFPKEQWLEVLMRLKETWESDPSQVIEYAEKLTEGVKQSDLITLDPSPARFSQDLLHETVENWKARMDFKDGGPSRAPKFPLPNNYQFLLRYAHLADDAQVKEQVYLTLDRMAFGGIYDQIGGGFARYSVDGQWKVPHFEKMLYDNAQLIALYAEAFQATEKALYRETVYETVDWLEREMTDESGAFYSALDADSEGEEGKFYVWSEEELQEVLGTDFDFVKNYYNLNAKGRWEHGNYILLRDRSDEDYAQQEGITIEELQATKEEVRKKLMERREGRVRPGLDDKSLTSWNAMMISGLVQAALAFDEDRFLDLALKNADFLIQHQWRSDGGLNHSYKGGTSSINGYLEDYALTAQAFIDLYQITLDEEWLTRTEKLTEYVMRHFSDEESQMFFFTSDEDPALITRKMEVDDNVIPASNSAMARVLHTLGTYFDKQEYLDRSLTMLNNMKSQIPKYGGGYSNWATLMLHEVYPYYEIAILGEQPEKEIREFGQQYIPNKLFMGDSDEDSRLPLLEYKYVEGETMIYVCVNKTCKLPVGTVKEAMGQID